MAMGFTWRKVGQVAIALIAAFGLLLLISIVLLRD